ncbi:MAG: NTP transferase domain-containing protein, partial [Bacteroidetes bacterium]|nr:NTP transferase domain-containing protein [Bacteroidota bacterium]
MRLATVTLAAGLGTRMKSGIPKILHKIFDKPIIHYVIESLAGLSPEKSIVVIGQGAESVADSLKGYPVLNVIQKEQKGTSDALKAAMDELEGFDGVLLVVNGDTPLLTTALLQDFLAIHQRNSEDLSILSFTAKGIHSYGRIIRSGNNYVKGIIEDRDADAEQKKINEVNSGVYAFEPHILPLLNEIGINERKGEYYLTDIVDIAVRKGYKVCAHNIAEEEQLAGINNRDDLYKAFYYLRNKIVQKWLDNGVSLFDKDTVF